MNLFGEDIVEEDAGAALLLPDDAPTLPAEPQAGILPPRENPVFFGHGAVEQSLLRLYNSGKMPHALVFAGAEGIGKLTLAYRLTRFLMTREIIDPNQDALFGPEPQPEAMSMEIAPDHPVFRRIAAGGHSDFILVERKFDEEKGQHKASVEIDEIRKIAPFLRMTAAEGGWRVAIINDADTMTRNAQNSVLKILEEPPVNTLLILIAHRPGALIPTIRSRARVINFAPLDFEHFQTLLRKQGHSLSVSEMQALYTLSEASVGRALELVDGGGLDVMGKVIALFENYPDWKWSQIHVIAEDMARSGHNESFLMFQNVMLWVARQLTIAKARGRSLPDGPLSALDLFSDMLNNTTLEALSRICENLQAHFETVNRSNLEKRQAVMKAFSIFSS